MSCDFSRIFRSLRLPFTRSRRLGGRHHDGAAAFYRREIGKQLNDSRWPNICLTIPALLEKSEGEDTIDRHPPHLHYRDADGDVAVLSA